MIRTLLYLIELLRVKYSARDLPPLLEFTLPEIFIRPSGAARLNTFYAQKTNRSLSKTAQVLVTTSSYLLLKIHPAGSHILQHLTILQDLTSCRTSHPAAPHILQHLTSCSTLYSAGYHILQHLTTCNTSPCCKPSHPAAPHHPAGYHILQEGSSHRLAQPAP